MGIALKQNREVTMDIKTLKCAAQLLLLCAMLFMPPAMTQAFEDDVPVTPDGALLPDGYEECRGMLEGFDPEAGALFINDTLYKITDKTRFFCDRHTHCTLTHIPNGSELLFYKDSRRNLFKVFMVALPEQGNLTNKANNENTQQSYSSPGGIKLENGVWKNYKK